MDNTKTAEEMADFEATLNQYIYAHIGLTLDSPITTPMDKGECKYMLRQMYGDYVSPLKKRIEELEAALQKIQNPVRFLQDQCAKEGKSLDGVMAVALSKDPVYLQEIARHALLNPSTNGK